MKRSQVRVLGVCAAAMLLGLAILVSSNQQTPEWTVSEAEAEASRKAAAVAAASWTPEKVKIFAEENRKARATKNKD